MIKIQSETSSIHKSPYQELMDKMSFANSKTLNTDEPQKMGLSNPICHNNIIILSIARCSTNSKVSSFSPNFQSKNPNLNLKDTNVLCIL